MGIFTELTGGKGKKQCGPILAVFSAGACLRFQRANVDSKFNHLTVSNELRALLKEFIQALSLFPPDLRRFRPDSRQLPLEWRSLGLQQRD